MQETTDVVGTTLAVAYTVTGGFALARPATITLRLPDNVAEEIESKPSAGHVTLWRLGDVPMPTTAI